MAANGGEGALVGTHTLNSKTPEDARGSVTGSGERPVEGLPAHTPTTGVQSTRKLLTIGGLAFVGGWVDVVCIVRYNAFAAMQTGNTVMIGKSIADSNEREADAFYYAVLVMCNMLGVVGLELIQWALSVRSSTRNPATILVLPTIILLVGCDVLDATMGSNKWHMCLPSAAFGAQNALVSSPRVLGIPTMIMTGNIGKVGTGVVKLCRATGSRQEALAVCQTYSANVIAVALTIVGAISAALAIRARGETTAPTTWCFAPAAGAIAGLLYVLGRMDVEQR